MSEVLLFTWGQLDLHLGPVWLEVGTTETKQGRLLYLPSLLRGIPECEWREHLERCPDSSYVSHCSGN